MFSADLSWTDPDTEKVGERRERIAKERSSSSAAPSLRSSRSSKSSIPDEGELWWTSSLKKAKGVQPFRKSRPDTSHSTNHSSHSRKGSIALPRTLEHEPFHDLRDPTLQPAWTYSTTLSTTLPSGAPLDPSEYEVPELEGDLSSRCTNSSGSRSSHERQLAWRTPGKVKVIDEVQEVQQLSPRSFIARTTQTSSEIAEPEGETEPTPSPKSRKKKWRPYSMNIERCQDLEAVKLRDLPDDDLATLPTIEKQSSHANGPPDGKLVAWKPPLDWDILLPLPHEPDNKKKLPPTPGDMGGIAIAHSSLLELTRFQRFIRRMESAGPKVILDRLKEEWHEPADEDTEQELILEKQLWVLTAFQLQSLGRSRSAPEPKANTGKILELYGNLSEVYQLSAMNTGHKVQYLTTKPQRPMPLPGNVSYLTIPQPGMVPFPYPDLSFSHIRASTLPTLVPSSKLPELLSECYRLLAPGGILEIRIMDAAPVRKTTGPAMRAWIEDRLSLNLEKLFRCSKPCSLMPGWVAGAGFELATVDPSKGESNMRLPCAYDQSSSNVDAELASLVGQALWKDIWGGFVDDVPGEPKWWWEDEEVMEECLKRQTVFECGSIYAFKC